MDFLPPRRLTALIGLGVALTVIAYPRAAESNRALGRGDRIPGKYIEVMRPGRTAATVTSRHGLAPEHVYSSALQGFAGNFAARELENLLADPDVGHLEEIRIMTIGA